MNFEHLQGLIAAPFTPMDRTGALNLELIPKYYRTLKSNGVKGAFICGSTGEGVSLTMKERKQVAEAWTSCAGADCEFKIITLVGGTCINECIELAQHGKQAGVDAFAIMAPYYFKPPNVETLAEICAVIGQAVSEIPFYYYHIPALTGVEFPMVNLLREVDGKIDNFAGIKYTHEDFMDFLSCLNFRNGKYNVLWGRDESLLSALALGAKGGVGSTFNYAAPLYHKIIDAYNIGDLELARSEQLQSIDMIRLLGKYGGIATGKAFMKLIGLDCGEFRLPLRNMDTKQFEFFRKDAEKLNFNSFCSKLPESSRAYL